MNIEESLIELVKTNESILGALESQMKINRDFLHRIQKLEGKYPSLIREVSRPQQTEQEIINEVSEEYFGGAG